mgnify:CR=1 FL=1
MEDPSLHPEFPKPDDDPAANPAADTAQQLRDLQDALRESLGHLAAGVGEIRTQLEAGVSELRAGEEPCSVGLALQNLQGFYTLLAQIGESFPDRPLPALDRLDAEMNAGVARLEEAEGAAAVAEGIEAGRLPALEGGSPAASEWAAAIGALSPELLDALP